MSDVKLKKDGTPYKKKVPKTPEAKANQVKGQFKPGQSGNVAGGNFRKKTREWREKCHDVMMRVGTEMTINILYDTYEKGNYKECLEIIKWMSEQAYGKPKEMADVDDAEVNSLAGVKPIIAIDRTMMMKVLAEEEEVDE